MKASSSRMNTISSNEANNEESISNTVLHIDDSGNVLVLMGQAQVLNPSTNSLEAVYVMLDTGADRSFISNELAGRLQLEDMDVNRLTISTFAHQEAMTRRVG